MLRAVFNLRAIIWHQLNEAATRAAFVSCYEILSRFHSLYRNSSHTIVLAMPLSLVRLPHTACRVYVSAAKDSVRRHVTRKKPVGSLVTRFR